MKNKIIVLSTFALFAAAPALAQESTSSDNQALLSAGVGYYDIMDDDGAADFRLEYRSGHEYFWHVKPWAGIEATSEGSVWGGGGILADIPVGESFYVAPSFGAGLYAQGGSDKDLGSAIEFRSQIEGGIKLDSGPRLGVAFGHISNASIGDKNPGTEILNVYFHIPVGGL